MLSGAKTGGQTEIKKKQMKPCQLNAVCRLTVTHWLRCGCPRYNSLSIASVPTGTCQRIETREKKDGLYWPSAEGEVPSPLGDLAAQAAADGYKPRQHPDTLSWLLLPYPHPTRRNCSRWRLRFLSPGGRWSAVSR